MNRTGGIALMLASVLLAAWAVALPAPPTPEPPEDAPDRADLERGRELYKQFKEGDLAALRAQFTEEMQATFTPQVLDESRRRMHEDLGRETKLVGENVRREGEYTLYLRQAHFDKKPDELVELRFGWNQAGAVVGFMIRPIVD